MYARRIGVGLLLLASASCGPAVPAAGEPTASPIELADWKQKIAAGDAALKSDPKNGAAYFNRGLAHFEGKNYRKAIDDFTASNKLEPRVEAFSLHMRAMCYDHLGETARADADSVEAIRLGLAPMITFGSRGDIYFQSGNYDGAITLYTKAIELHPNGAATYHWHRGTAYQKKGDEERFRADRAKAAELDPSLKPE